MPLARIITRHTEEAAELASRLQSQGYEVEVWSPDETRTGACDVELVLDKAPVAQAMASATEFARANDADVFVGTGLLVNEAQRRQQQEAARREEERLAAEAASRKRAEEERHREAEIAAARAAQEAAERRSREEMERRERERRIAAEAEARRRAEEEALARIAAEVEQRRRAEQEAARIAANAAERLRREEQAAAAEAERERERRMVAEAEARRRAEEDAAREAVLDARIAEATARAEQVASVTETHERREQKRVVPSVEHLTAPYIPSRKLPVRPPAPRRALRGRERDLRVAAVASIAMAIILAFLWTVLSNQRPADPLGRQEIMRSNDIEQAAPFGAARTKPVATAPVSQPQTQSTEPAPQKSAKAAPQQKPKPSPSRRANRTDEVEVMPEDVVIRHYNRPAKTAAPPTQQRAGVKVISDLEVD